MSLFSTWRLYRDRQKPANGTQCPTLVTDSYRSFTCIITDMITHGMSFVEPVGVTCRSKSVTLRWQVNC